MKQRVNKINEMEHMNEKSVLLIHLQNHERSTVLKRSF